MTEMPENRPIFSFFPNALRVLPRQIAKQLVNGLEKHLRPGLKLAFSDEDVLFLMADQDVGLPLLVESLAGGALEMRRQDYDEMVPQRFLVLVAVDAGVPFHLDPSFVNDTQDVSVNLLVKRRFRGEFPNRSSWFGDNDLFLCHWHGKGCE
jgi:hypothetical protein